MHSYIAFHQSCLSDVLGQEIQKYYQQNKERIIAYMLEYRKKKSEEALLNQIRIELQQHHEQSKNN